jgi:predicted TIM-barrel fold metal-dependent hydrolase
MQHPLMRVPDVDTKPLLELLSTRPELRVILLGALRGKAITQLIRAGNVYLEISTLEGLGGISKLLSRVPSDRILFGSHCPFFILESAIFKLQESELLPPIANAITHENARRLLKTPTVTKAYSAIQESSQIAADAL